MILFGVMQDIFTEGAEFGIYDMFYRNGDFEKENIVICQVNMEVTVFTVLICNFSCCQFRHIFRNLRTKFPFCISLKKL